MQSRNIEKYSVYNAAFENPKNNSHYSENDYSQSNYIKKKIFFFCLHILFSNDIILKCRGIKTIFFFFWFAFFDVTISVFFYFSISLFLYFCIFPLSSHLRCCLLWLSFMTVKYAYNCNIANKNWLKLPYLHTLSAIKWGEFRTTVAPFKKKLIYVCLGIPLQYSPWLWACFGPLVRYYSAHASIVNTYHYLFLYFCIP